VTEAELDFFKSKPHPDALSLPCPKREIRHWVPPTLLVVTESIAVVVEGKPGQSLADSCDFHQCNKQLTVLDHSGVGLDRIPGHDGWLKWELSPSFQPQWKPCHSQSSACKGARSGWQEDKYEVSPKCIVPDTAIREGDRSKCAPIQTQLMHSCR